ncbi:MAG: divergent polysaccharide deacetylase family protein [Megasphaera sp.]|jgi:polysaccharide deacetylase 2 family uncharacterized protein YibQ|nr:divergent polysaccharide deacetylase family protein [Megasphaera sp.]MCI1247466.1 divergent polysaccharide deacetylase family protein [Megasphaera sp.]
MRRKQTRRKTDGALIRPLSVLFLLIALCVGAYWNVNGDTVSEQMADTKMVHIEDGRDDGKDVSYTDTSIDVQRAVDTWLQSQQADVKTVDTQERTEQRRATGGTISWTTRSKEVVPSKKFTREDLEKQLAKSNGKAVLYRTEKTKHEGKDVTEYDIAHFNMLDKEQLYLVTDKLYVTEPEQKPGVIQKLKELILGSSSGSLKDVKKEENAPAQSKDTQKHPAQIKGRLAIVIDDCGSSMDNLKKFNSIPIPLTYAVMPDKTHTSDSAKSGHDAGRKIFVHMPMEPLSVASSEKVYISKEMGDSKIKSTANSLIDQVPYAVGMNNHQGSAATADSRVMKDVMAVLKKRNLAYLDSRTNKDSVGEQTASAAGLATTRNNLFIDNDADVASVKKRLKQAGQIAKNNGSAVVIGHCRLNTAQAISEMVDELHSEGIDIVFATELM